MVQLHVLVKHFGAEQQPFVKVAKLQNTVQQVNPVVNTIPIVVQKEHIPVEHRPFAIHVKWANTTTKQLKHLKLVVKVAV